MNSKKVAVISSLSTILVLSIVFAWFFYNSRLAQNPITENGDHSESRKNIIEANLNRTERIALNDEITNGRHNIITNTVSSVSPAVVGINVTEIRKYRDPWANDPFWRRFFGDRVYSKEVKGLGSGAIISEDGYILTNDHVAGNAAKIIVTMTDGTQYDAKLIGTDPVSDVCLLKIDARNLTYIKMGDSDDILIGEWVIALGNPFGLFAINDKPTVTVGVVSAKDMNLGAVEDRYYLSMIQTDAAINGGNSGGPLVNSIGELIGLNTLIYTAGSSTGNVGVGFAIPINKVRKITDELKTKSGVNRDFWTGLRIQTIDEGIARYYDLPSTRGVIITQVARNSPASKAGLEVGDIILEAGKFKINDENTMIGVLQEFRRGESIRIKVIRNDETITKYMKLEGKTE